MLILLAILLGLLFARWPVIVLGILGGIVTLFLLMGAGIEIGDRRHRRG